MMMMMASRFAGTGRIDGPESETWRSLGGPGLERFRFHGHFLLVLPLSSGSIPTIR
jgi:hypothetical protein